MNEKDIFHFNTGVLDIALSEAFGHPASALNSFEREAVLSESRCATNCILNGKTNVEDVAWAIHYGWGIAVSESLQKADTEDAAVKYRVTIASIPYKDLTASDKQNYRIGAQAMLRLHGITGEKLL